MQGLILSGRRCGFPIERLACAGSTESGDDHPTSRGEPPAFSSHCVKSISLTSCSTRRICDRHLDDIEPLSDAHYPFVASNCREPLGHRLVQRGRRDSDGVRDAVHVLDRDAAGSDWRGGRDIITPFVRYSSRTYSASSRHRF